MISTCNAGTPSARRAGAICAATRRASEITPAFRDMIGREFPNAASEWDDGVSRRNFMKLMGASLALAGVWARLRRRKPEYKIVPYVQQPEQLVPGRPLFYASTMPFGGFGRASSSSSTKAGPPRSTATRTIPAALAAPTSGSRPPSSTSTTPTARRSSPATARSDSWGNFTNSLADLFTYEGRRALTKGPRRHKPRAPPADRDGHLADAASPRSQELARRLGDRFRWHAYDPVGRDNAGPVPARIRAGRQPGLSFQPGEGDPVAGRQLPDRRAGKPALCPEVRRSAPGASSPDKPVRDRQTLAGMDRERNRLYVVESTPTITGAIADPQRIARSVSGRLPSRSWRLFPALRNRSFSAALGSCPANTVRIRFGRMG